MIILLKKLIIAQKHIIVIVKNRVKEIYLKSHNYKVKILNIHQYDGIM